MPLCGIDANDMTAVLKMAEALASLGRVNDEGKAAIARISDALKSARRPYPAAQTARCAVCGEVIYPLWTHAHSGDSECWTGDGSTAIPRER